MTITDVADKTIALKIAPSQASVGAGVAVLRSLPTPALEAVGPFVFLDQFGPGKPPPEGVPAHPHAGIEVISYLLSGENDHRDSFGNAGTIAAGGAQWISSGRGMLHAEILRGGADGLMNTVQLWTRQPAAFDDQPPRYGSVAADNVPQIAVPGAHVKLLSGELPLYFGEPGPIRLQGPAQLIHIALAPGASLTLPLEPSHEMAVYVLAGAAGIGGEDCVTRRTGVAASGALGDAGESRRDAGGCAAARRRARAAPAGVSRPLRVQFDRGDRTSLFGLCGRPHGNARRRAVLSATAPRL